MIGPVLGSAAAQVRAGDSGAACIEVRASALYLAVPAARPQLPQHHTATEAGTAVFADIGAQSGNSRGLCLAQPQLKSVPATAERPASKPEPVPCTWLC